MEICECCGNSYDKPLRIDLAGETHIFDCFECAIHLLAPDCEHCGTKIIGHGVEADDRIFCCAHCARSVGKVGLIDHVPDRTLPFESTTEGML